jgi:antitoxin component HigA of HigAB toxin-antitoxin module
MIRPIHNDEEYGRAVAKVRLLWNAEPGNPEHDELEMLGSAVADYEDNRWSMPGAHPDKPHQTK